MNRIWRMLLNDEYDFCRVKNGKHEQNLNGYWKNTCRIAAFPQIKYNYANKQFQVGTVSSNNRIKF